MRALLFSGGVESTCLAVMTRPDLAVTIDYGQVCAPGEIRAAKHIASLLGMPHRVIEVSLDHLGSGEMTGIPSDETAGRVSEHWPFRNQMLLTVAAMALADSDLRELIIGTVLTDRVHNDGTPEFLTAMERLLLTQLADFRLSAPASTITTDDLVRRSGVDRDLLGWTFSCHRAEVACGACRGCNKSLELFAGPGRSCISMTKILGRPEAAVYDCRCECWLSDRKPVVRIRRWVRMRVMDPYPDDAEKGSGGGLDHGLNGKF